MRPNKQEEMTVIDNEDDHMKYSTATIRWQVDARNGRERKLLQQDDVTNKFIYIFMRLHYILLIYCKI